MNTDAANKTDDAPIHGPETLVTEKRRVPADQHSEHGTPKGESGSEVHRPLRTGRPRSDQAPGPDRAKIVAAVMQLAEERGQAGINMRALASALKISPKLLYRHVRNKDELIDLAAEAILQHWELPSPALAWQDRLTVIFTAGRNLVHRFPALAQRPLLRSLQNSDSPQAVRVTEAIKACLRDAGLSLKQANDVLFVYEAFLLGEIVIAKALSTERRVTEEQPAMNTGFDVLLTYFIAGIEANSKLPRTST